MVAGDTGYEDDDMGCDIPEFRAIHLPLKLWWINFNDLNLLMVIFSASKKVKVWSVNKALKASRKALKT